MKIGTLISARVARQGELLEIIFISDAFRGRHRRWRHSVRSSLAARFVCSQFKAGVVEKRPRYFSALLMVMIIKTLPPETRPVVILLYTVLLPFLRFFFLSCFDTANVAFEFVLRLFFLRLAFSRIFNGALLVPFLFPCIFFFFAFLWNGV